MRQSDKKGRKRIVGSLVAIATLVGATAYWNFWRDGAGETSDSESAAIVASGGEDRGGAPKSRQSDQLAKKEDLSKAQEGRAIITRIREDDAEPDLANVYARAEAFKDTGMASDAYLLYFFAARRGHVPSAMMLGTMADPAYFADGSGLMDEPDPGQALKWYRMAAQGGSGEARVRLEALRTHLEIAAAAGNRQAQRLLLQWKE